MINTRISYSCAILTLSIGMTSAQIPDTTQNKPNMQNINTLMRSLSMNTHPRGVQLSVNRDNYHDILASDYLKYCHRLNLSNSCLSLEQIEQILSQCCEDKLIFLDLQSNNLETLPDKIDRFTNIRHIDLSYNQLTSPVILATNSGPFINMAGNPIQILFLSEDGTIISEKDIWKL